MTDREPEPGDVLGGRYQILGELGRGGMATVYRGRDTLLQRPVAVKAFRSGFAEAVDPRRITQEMRLLAGVDHPCVVSVLDASTGDGVFGAYLVMELVAGDDLGALLHRARGPLSADFARRIVADVAGALEALHARDIVHRDVKPGNILVLATGVSPDAAVTAKLTDFGIAQMVDGAALTEPEAILGTAAYLSPEQVRGARPRPASDVYSLGLVLLESLTGRRAFPGGAAEAAMARLQRPPALPPDASPALADLLSRMTALDPDHRPPAREVAETLREQLVGKVTAPDAVQTAPTPIAGLRAVPVAGATGPDPIGAAASGPAAIGAAAIGADATAPQEPVWGPETGAPAFDDIALGRTGGTAAATGAVPAGTGAQRLVQTGERRRFPAVLAVAASALAAAVAGVVISAGAGFTAAAPDAAAKPAPASSSAAPPPAVAAQQEYDTGPQGAPAAAVAPAVPSRTATATPKPTPTVTPSPTPTSTPSATPAVPGGDDPVGDEPAPASTPEATPSTSQPGAPAAPVVPVAPPSSATPDPGTSPAPTDTAGGTGATGTATGGTGSGGTDGGTSAQSASASPSTAASAA